MSSEQAGDKHATHNQREMTIDVNDEQQLNELASCTCCNVRQASRWLEGREGVCVVTKSAMCRCRRFHRQQRLIEPED
jgi:uncharacterized Fe-S radical SAM superfamily protein PflX